MYYEEMMALSEDARISRISAMSKAEKLEAAEETLERLEELVLGVKAKVETLRNDVQSKRNESGETQQQDPVQSSFEF